jgi:hypothetical protein
LYNDNPEIQNSVDIGDLAVYSTTSNVATALHMLVVVLSIGSKGIKSGAP